MSARPVHIIAYVEASSSVQERPARGFLLIAFRSPQESCAPEEYDVLLCADVDETLIFEPFNVGEDSLIAWFTEMVGEWRIGPIYHTDWTFKHMQAGDTFIWVKEGLRDLPNIEELTRMILYHFDQFGLSRSHPDLGNITNNFLSICRIF